LAHWPNISPCIGGTFGETRIYTLGPFGPMGQNYSLISNFYKNKKQNENRKIKIYEIKKMFEIRE